jgi:hypothetical protein
VHGPVEVDSGFSAIGAVSGKGSAAARKALVGELFGRATADEQRFLVGLLGELRQGALEGGMTGPSRGLPTCRWRGPPGQRCCAARWAW